ncbi:MAG: bifunctional UDP-N-acetylglucosamine diphosphorylase/glucosamine-1-phosphate N-acetyltransferase GlmU [Terriglobales bacterium]
MPKSTRITGNHRIAIAIMAAGKGTRLKSRVPKVLHEVGGKPLLAHVIAAATRVVPADDVFVIIGHEAARVRDAVVHMGVRFVSQDEQRGTGHALMVARDALKEYGTAIVLSGDAPLIRSETIERLRDFHASKKADMTILSACLEDPAGYGRVIRKNKNGAKVTAIIEEKSARPAQRKIREINSGFYAFNVKSLFTQINQLQTNNAHGEYYLTDMAAVLVKAGQNVVAIEAENTPEILGGNTRAELADIDQLMRRAKARQLMAEGVTIFYPDTCVIDSDARVGSDTTIEPFVQILGNTRIGGDCRVRSYSVIQDSEIGDSVLVRQGCILHEAKVKSGAVVGPYSHLRPGSEIGEGAHVGNFVETKKVRLGKGSKANHLTYLGDAEIGKNVNIGAGTITCNYDGGKKHTTIIEDDVFVGSDSTLVAPVTIGKGSYVAASSCITKNVPADSLALGRAKQVIKDGWAKEKRKSRVTAAAGNQER